MAVRSAGPCPELNSQYKPVVVIKRAGPENLKSIKLLYAAIINFGGGQSELDSPVNEYADASALYYRERMVESANLFTRNEMAITAITIKASTKYKMDTEELHEDVIRQSVAVNLGVSQK